MTKLDKLVSEYDFEAVSEKYGIAKSNNRTVLRYLWHYTDVNGFFGICNNNSLWATHYKFLNDSTELRWATSLAKVALEKKQKNKNSKWAAAFIDEALSRLDPNNHSLEAYLICLSSKKDSLSQWRAYGGRKGYNIGLDIKALRTLKFVGVEHSWFVKVEYDQSVQEKKIESAINEIIALLDAAEKSSVVDAKQWAIDYFDVIIAEISIYFKHPSFADESEWRLALVVPTGSVSYRPTNRGLVPFLNIQFPLNGVSHIPIGTIKLGPGADRTKEGHEVRRFLKQLGYGRVGITYSAAPFAPTN